MPQVEVTFDIDANGILNVSAKDKATGKEQKIVIKASSGLSEDEIKRMVRDAEAHAEEDRKFRELVETRNHADALVHATEKSLQGPRRQGARRRDRAKIESALSDLKAVLKGDDKDEIETKAERAGARPRRRSPSRPTRASSRRAPGGRRRRGGGRQRRAARTTCVDAEFEEVKDKDGKAS